MKILLVVLIVCLQLQWHMVEAAIEESSSKNGKTSQVVDLTVGNFEHLTQATTGATTGDWFVKFYAPWCGHCKVNLRKKLTNKPRLTTLFFQNLKPHWDKAASELKGKVKLGAVDATVHQRFGN